MYSIFGFLNKQKKEKISNENAYTGIIPILQSNTEISDTKEKEKNDRLQNQKTVEFKPRNVKKSLDKEKFGTKKINKNTKTKSKKSEKKTKCKVILKNNQSDNNSKNIEKLDSDRIVSEISQIDKKIQVLKIYHDKIFNQIVTLIKERKENIAKIKSLELSIIRKKINRLENSKRSLEQASIRLSLFYDINETLDVLDPILRNTIADKENLSNNKKIGKKKVTKNCNQFNDDWKSFFTTKINDTLRNDGITLNLESIEDVKDIFSKVFNVK